MDLYYNEYGTDGPPLVILHGLLGASGNWHTLSRNAFSTVAHVFAVDQRNHGRSPHDSQFDYTVMAADTWAFMNQHNLVPGTLLGHSMGGKTAMQTALTYPDAVDRLIVVDMAPKAYPPHHEDLIAALQRIDPSAHDDRESIDAALAEDVPVKPIRQFLLKNLEYDGDAYTWQMNLDVIQDNYDAVNAPIEAETPYDGPALFVRGAKSDYVADDDEARIRELFPQAKLVTIDGAGHWVHADRPRALADVVVDFLET